MIVGDQNGQNRRQHISSPTSVTNIDVTVENCMLSFSWKGWVMKFLSRQSQVEPSKMKLILCSASKLGIFELNKILRFEYLNTLAPSRTFYMIVLAGFKIFIDWSLKSSLPHNWTIGQPKCVCVRSNLNVGHFRHRNHKCFPNPSNEVIWIAFWRDLYKIIWPC